MWFSSNCNNVPGEDITIPVYLTPATICWEARGEALMAVHLSGNWAWNVLNNDCPD